MQEIGTSWKLTSGTSRSFRDGSWIPQEGHLRFFSRPIVEHGRSPEESHSGECHVEGCLDEHGVHGIRLIVSECRDRHPAGDAKQCHRSKPAAIVGPEEEVEAHFLPKVALQRLDVLPGKTTAAES
jgi:hypothetical protein